MRTIANILGAVIVVLVAIGIVYSFNNFLSEKRGKWPDSPLVGKPAPDFLLNLFEGKTVKLEDMKGKNVVLNFWASWCLPCAEEAEEINRAEKVFGKDGVVFIGVNILDGMEDAVGFVAKHKITYPNGYDPGKTIHIDYGVAGVPETFFINGEGIITRKKSGPLTFADISEALN